MSVKSFFVFSNTLFIFLIFRSLSLYFLYLLSRFLKSRIQQLGVRKGRRSARHQQNSDQSALLINLLSCFF